MVQVYLKEKGGEIFSKPKENILSVADSQEIPKAAKKYYEKGLKLAQEKKHEDAATQFGEAIKAFPDYLYAINKLGEQYAAMNKLAEAQTAFERAIAINSKFALPYINLGILHIQQKQYAKAIADYERAIKILGDKSARAQLIKDELNILRRRKR